MLAASASLAKQLKASSSGQDKHVAVPSVSKPSEVVASIAELGQRPPCDMVKAITGQKGILILYRAEAKHMASSVSYCSACFNQALGHAKLAHHMVAAGATLQSTHDVHKTAAAIDLEAQAQDLQSTVAAGH